MNQKYIVQSENVPSSPSTGTDFSQELSPFRRDSQDAVHLLEGQCSTLSQLFSEDSIMSVNRNIQKPIFKIIRETKQQPKTNLDSDLGNYNRKDKSLGELSRKLLVMFGKFEECSISLDAVTQQLGVERRRIYDIINILESLGVVYRKRKNSYQWKGLKSIQGTLKKLQQQNFREGDLNEEIDSDGEETQQSQARIKREKSLGLLSTGFIKLFFSWKKIISLEEAGRKLSANNIEENKIRTKIRRLYDIANVFSSLGLIHKTCLDTKKPAYQWIGSAGLEAFMQRLNTCSDETQIFFEIDPKKKEKECLAKEEQAQENPPCFSIQSNNSAFKAFESVIQNSNPVDNLLTALLNLYKGSAEKKEVSTQVCTNKDLNLPNFTIKSCKPIQKNVELAVPKIKKSVSIIQKVNLENSVSALTEGFFGKAQKACTSNSTTGFKRRVIGHNDSLEENLVKKICSFKNFERKIAF